MTEALKALLGAIGRFFDDYEIASPTEGEFIFRIESEIDESRPSGRQWVVLLAPRGSTQPTNWSDSKAARYTI